MDPKQLHVIQALEKAGATEHLTDRETSGRPGRHHYPRLCLLHRWSHPKSARLGITQETLNANTDLVAAVNAE